MTAKEFLEHDNTIWRKIDDSNLTKATLIEFAQAYHESEVKKLGLFSVVGQSEQLKAFFQEIENDKTYILNDYYKNKAKRLRESL
ncbi:MAG: hypothetical protein BWX59_01975 [Bacteroidetes bacterium ADurb.Bin028]|nr:MAG: hypothetical protein BWX59_01975 [Bacteroidetes bacterium ADurb.Bin028]